VDVPEPPVPLFTLAQAREVLAQLRDVLDDIVLVRADAAELAVAVQGRRSSPRGGLPEFKAAQARLDELLTQVQQTGAVLRGLAPLLLDFAGELDGEQVQLCWLEGEPELEWYHPADVGFAGRRRLP
jgi:arsenite methyltransferase